MGDGSGSERLVDEGAEVLADVGRDLDVLLVEGRTVGPIEELEQAEQLSVVVERKANEEQEAKVIETLRSKGRTVVIPDIAPFQKAVEPVYEQYGKTIGLDKIRMIQSQ